MDDETRTIRLQRRGGRTNKVAQHIADAVEQGKTIRVEQPNWQRCPACGKTGSHTHGKDTRPMLLGDSIEGPLEQPTIEDVREVVRRFATQPDPEHEPGNPNCLCFQPSCILNLRPCIYSELGVPELDPAGDLCRDCRSHDRIDRRDGSCPALDSNGYRMPWSLEEFITEVVASRREALKHMSADDVRAFFQAGKGAAVDAAYPESALERKPE